MTRKRIRGSGLLFAGRLLSKGINFFVQVLIVRALTKDDYGAFAYALSLVTLGQVLVTLGLDRAVTRFLPVFHERRTLGKFRGTLFLVVGGIVSLSVVAIVMLFTGDSWILSVVGDRRATGLLSTMIFLVPVQAIDDLMIGTFAVFGAPRQIFFRRHVLAPLLKLAAVLAMLAAGSDVFVLATGYLAATTVGVLIFLPQMIRLLKNQGIFAEDGQTTVVPWVEIFAFTMPLFTTDLVYLSLHAVGPVMLEHLHGTIDVAALRAVQPVAMLNQIVMLSFATLFTPAAARMFARNDGDGLNRSYWQTAAWVAVLTFPVFLITFSLAPQVTVLLFGDRYAESSTILAFLALGYYFNAALGFNGTTLTIYGAVGTVVAINMTALVISLGLNLLLIPTYGALGAGIATCFSLIGHNIAKQVGLHWKTGISLFDRQYLRVYGSIILATLLLLAIEALGNVPFIPMLVLAAIASMAVLRTNRDLLAIKDTFPELLRLPLLPRLLS